jgi:anti-sigma B factor antagonist
VISEEPDDSHRERFALGLRKGRPSNQRATVQHPELTEEHIQPGIDAIRVLGELDLATVAEFEARVADTLHGDPLPILLDLSGCSFIDTSVLAALLQLRAHSGSSDRHRFAVVALAQPLRLLRLTGLDRQIPVYETARDALYGIMPADSANDDPESADSLGSVSTWRVSLS